MVGEVSLAMGLSIEYSAVVLEEDLKFKNSSFRMIKKYIESYEKKYGDAYLGLRLDEDCKTLIGVRRATEEEMKSHYKERRDELVRSVQYAEEKIKFWEMAKSDYREYLNDQYSEEEIDIEAWNSKHGTEV